MLFKSTPPFFLIIISAGLVFIFSCKKGGDGTWTVNDNPDKTICISVKDYSTNQPVHGASVTININGFASAMNYSGVSDAGGNTCISYDDDYLFLKDFNATMTGYDLYCETYGFNPHSIPSSKEIFLLKRDSYILFRFINSGAVFPQDSLILYFYSNLSGCSGQGQLQINPGAPADTTIIYSSVPGSIHLEWLLYRDNSLVIGGGSFANVTVPTADTLLFNINY